ncbi:MAG: ECF transporter S component [Firmicutes bacterium]|nr:ECF transporter S component [Bacillota bacterium]
MMNKRTVNIAIVGIMSALATVAYMLLPEIPLVPGVDYLKIDISVIPVVLTGISFGIPSGIAVSVIKNLIHLTRTTTFGIGECMDVLIGITMVIAMRAVIRALMRRKGAVKYGPREYYIATAVCIAATVVVGWLANAALTPLYFHIAGFPLTAETLMAGVWGSTLLNVVKSAVTTIPFYPLARAINIAAAKIGY